MHPKQLLIKDFDYDLPEEKIAKHPLEKRDESRLLVYDAEKIQDDIFLNLANHLEENSLIIFNNTKVVEARLLFKKSTGTTIELFCLAPADEYSDITSAMLQTKKILWKCLIGNAKKWKDELLIKTIRLKDQNINLCAKKSGKQYGDFLIEFFWDEEISFAEVLHAAGSIPLPPYLHRDAEESDKERYQTVYAKYDGSVAAPTAGLHFTDDVFQKLSKKNIQKDFVTLHVGAGTFKPVKTEMIEAHEMHEEFFEVNIDLIENLIYHLDKNIIAVGTTTLRTLESLYWMGEKIIQKSKIKNQKKISNEELSIKQWDAYDLDNENISANESLNAVLNWMKENDQIKLISKTKILIAPPYKLKVVKNLITNFHQPKSTLLLLIAAVAGNNWKKIYDHALKNNYRFLSYGDSCLLKPL